MEKLSGHVIKGYELRDRIGAGGFGAVYKAYQSTVGREVAVKIILPHFSNHPDFIRRFETEAQLIARLEHLHIVPLYDYWRDGDGAYLVMRWLRGGSLGDILQKGPIELGTAVLLIDQITSALSSAHRNNVIHRDLKPGNILLDEDDNAYLADFGIAKDLTIQQGITEIDSIVGSPDYLAPEQARSEPVTPQTDIYSLGVVLYEMLAGKHPFTEVSTVERLYKHLNEPLPEIATLPVNVADEVNAVIQKATAKDPRNRFADALELAAALRQAAHISERESIVETLTQREHEILHLIIEGRSNKEIADKLVITVMTVKWYVTQIYRKLGVRSRVQAIVRARELNLIAGRDANGGTQVLTNVAVPMPDDVHLQNPYKGLCAFQAADYQDFFGREKVIEKLVKRLADDTPHVRFLAVVGPSGSGKSSLVKAGLIPALWRGDIPGSEKWFVVEMLPGSNPLDELEIALIRIAASQGGNLAEQLRRDKRGLLRTAGLILPDDGSELVLVIDQFEEVFTLVEDEDERMHFLDLLHTAVVETRSRVRIIITLRADFYDRPLHYPHFGELIRSRMETILPMSAEELERAITYPAERMGVAFEPGLVASIVAEVNYQPGALPLLQYALTELFEQRQGRLLTQEAYLAIGKTIGALAKRADEIFVHLDTAGQEAVRQMFLRLVTLGEGTEDTRRRVTRSELMSITDDPDLMEELIDTFAAYRLLSLDNDPDTRSPTVELAHEALLREWERLRGWLNVSREEIRIQRQIAGMANDWQKAHQDTSFLAYGTRLEQFQQWSADTNLALTKVEHDFIQASIAEHERRKAAEREQQEREKNLEKRSLNFLRVLVGVLLIAVLGAFGLTSVAVNNANEAQNNFITAERIRLAAQAHNALNQGEGGDLPALLALHSLKLGYSPDADTALLSALRRGFTRQIYVGHTDHVNDAVFSPDGQLIASVGADNTVRLWNAQTGEEIRQLTGHTDALLVAGFISDGQQLVTAATDNTIRIWDTSTGQEINQFRFEENLWIGIPSLNGRFILAGFANGNAHLLDTQSGEIIHDLVGHTSTITYADFSGDSRYVLTTSNDRTARLWDVETGQLLRMFSGHSDAVNGGAFSPDGKFVITTGADNTARIWNIATGNEVQRLIGHTDWLIDGRISPDGRYALTTSNDKTARLWDVRTGRELRQFIGHTNSVWPGRFSADGRFVLTGSSDRTIRLWNVEAITEPRIFTRTDFTHNSQILSAGLLDGTLVTIARDALLTFYDSQTGENLRSVNLGADLINDAVFSFDQQLAAAVNADGVLAVWDIETGNMQFQVNAHEMPINCVRFSPDGQFLLTAGADGTAKLWDLNGELVREFIGHTADVWGIAFSPDGTRIVTGSSDRTARLWNAETGETIQQFVGHADVVRGVDISPDGAQIVTGGSDQTVRLWDANSGEESQRITDHNDEVLSVSFSADGQHILTGSVDQTARVWDVHSGQSVRQLSGHVGSVLIATFSGDGRFIITGDTASTYIWRADLNTLIEFTCSLLSRDFTDEERERYRITDDTAACPQLAANAQSIQAGPTWTAVPPQPTPDWTPIPHEPVDEIFEFVLLSERDNYEDFAMPALDVYQPEGDALVSRIPELTEATLQIQLYSANENVPADFNPPFELGPWSQGVPLGFTLEKWISAEGHGSYTVRGDRARLDLVFDNLIPNSVYTLWCVEMTLIPEYAVVIDPPCGAPDGSESIFYTDADGHGEYSVELDPFPLPTEESFMQVAVAYHSDGQTHGPRAGEFGKNVHVQLFYDFLPPN